MEYDRADQFPFYFSIRTSIYFSNRTSIHFSIRTSIYFSLRTDIYIYPIYNNLWKIGPRLTWASKVGHDRSQGKHKWRCTVKQTYKTLFLNQFLACVRWNLFITNERRMLMRYNNPSTLLFFMRIYKSTISDYAHIKSCFIPFELKGIGSQWQISIWLRTKRNYASIFDASNLDL